MSDSIKNNTKVAIELEAEEGTYLAPQAATSFISPLPDGLELSMGKELLERNNMNGSIGKNTPRTGMKSSSGSISVEAKAHGTAGSQPEYGLLLEAALGGQRNSATATSKSSGNTATVLQIENADIAKFAVGDIVLVKQTGAYHVSPITAVDTTNDAANITLLVPHPSTDMTDSVVVAAFNTYYPTNSGHPTFSLSKYIEDARRETASGCRVTNLALNNFSTGQLADFSFGFEGMNFSSDLEEAPPYTPSYNTALPPIVLSAVLYVNGSAVELNDLSFSVENSIAWKTSTQSEGGRVSSRFAERKISGSFNPYKQSNSQDNYTRFLADTEFSIFGYMAVPTATPGEFKDVVAFYMPKCIITEFAEEDKDGLLQEALTFSATRGVNGSTNEIYITTI